MCKIPIMPDLPIEYVRYFNNNSDFIIFMEKYFIKKIDKCIVNIKPLVEITKLNLDGFNNHKRIFINDYGTFLYLVAPYLSDYKDMVITLKTKNPKEILLIFQNLFKNIEIAHKNCLYLFDIKFDNFLLSPNNQAVFTDFDFIIYNGICSIQNTRKTFFKVEELGIDNDIENSDALIINDKLLMLKMLLYSLSYHYTFYIDSDLLKLQKAFDIIKENYTIDSKVITYLNRLLINKTIPEKDGYFIETIINPLLEDGIILKKTI